MIVIVGAGLAGLSAAWKLTQANCFDFVVLEAQDRIGGRIQSIYHKDGCRLDLGAQWLHGQEENPIYKWLKELDCVEGPEDEEVEFEGVFVSQTGKPVSRLLVSKVLEILLEAKGQLYKLSPLVSRDKRCKPVDIFRRCVEQAISKCPVLQSADRTLIEAIQRWFELYEMIDNSCESLGTLSIKAYSEWSDFDGGQMVKLKGGWQRLVDIMVNAIGREKILFNSEVLQIDYSDAEICVKLATGPDIECDHVIVTVSLGVLQDPMRANFFKPPLEQKRMDLIKKSGYGPANKIFLEFERPYLRQERGLKLLWLPTEQKEKEEWPSWMRYVTGFDLVNGAPDCLLAWVGGAGAIEMEADSDEQVAQACLRLLKICTPLDKQPPKLTSITRSRWCTNPYFNGAYSYQSVATEDQALSDLWDPIYDDHRQSSSSENPSPKATPKPRVLFAGEATATRMYSTAHGAILSGWREADRLLSLPVDK